MGQSHELGVHEWMAAQYGAISDRRNHNFAFYWQSAALVIAAHAFLLNIELCSGTSCTGRVAAAVIGIFAS